MVSDRTRGRTLVLLLFGALFLSPSSVQGQPQLSRENRTLIAEAFRLAERVQDSVWTDWSDAPFALLFVTERYEYLLRHPNPSADFEVLGYDDYVGDTVRVRPRTFAPNLRATFPAVGGVPTVVMGPPDSSESPVRWVLTAMHEHFHQWQMSRPGYYAAVDSLDLAQGDDSGQWMLNYRFPYDSTEVQRRFADLARRLHDALQVAGTPEESQALDRFFAARRAFTQALPEDDYRYFSFQLWQEGVARYVEHQVARYAATRYTPTRRFRALRRNESFAEIADTLRRRIGRRLLDMSLGEDRRVAFYPVGAAEALLLDGVNPNWRRRYWTEKFFLERYYDSAAPARK